MNKAAKIPIQVTGIQHRVYEATRLLKTPTSKEVGEFLDVPSKKVTMAFRKLREKGLILYRKPTYRIANSTALLQLEKPKINQILIDPILEDQLEWNKMILDRKAAREARKHLNL